MIFCEKDRVIYREGGVGPPRHGVIIGKGQSIGPVYFVEVPKTDGTADCVTASAEELEIKKKYIVAQEHELEKEKRK